MADYDLVFEGGGAKGSSFVGALQALTAAGHNHRRLVGTSAGAITATLLAAGYTPKEMLEAANEHLPNGKPRFSSFMDPPNADIRHYEKHICRLPARGYGTTQFDMDPERLKALIDSGRKAMEDFLAPR
jgi:predicted acylesterase/phospholipase RssA